MLQSNSTTQALPFSSYLQQEVELGNKFAMMVSSRRGCSVQVGAAVIAPSAAHAWLFSSMLLQAWPMQPAAPRSLCTPFLHSRMDSQIGTCHSTCTMRGSIWGGFTRCASCLCAVPGSRERPGWQHSAAGTAGGGSCVPEEPQPSWRWVPHNASTSVPAAAGGRCPGMPGGASTPARGMISAPGTHLPACKWDSMLARQGSPIRVTKQQGLHVGACSSCGAHHCVNALQC